jgi:dolichol-phosphate mannosyltransferase
MAALDEEEGIGPTIKDIEEHIDAIQILVVDGFSKDKTAEIANHLGAKVIYRESLGKGDALAHAINHLDEDFNYLVFIDADYTYPAESISQMLKIIEENPHVGMVSGNRFNSHFQTERMNDLFYMGNRLLAFTHNLLNGVAMRDPLSGLRIVRWSILKNWKPKSKGFDIEVEMNHRVEDQGYGISEIDIPYRRRLGEKKLRARHGFQILKRMVADIKL